MSIKFSSSLTRVAAAVVAAVGMLAAAGTAQADALAQSRLVVTNFQFTYNDTNVQPRGSAGGRCWCAAPPWGWRRGAWRRT